MLPQILQDVSSDQECNQKHWTVTQGQHREQQNILSQFLCQMVKHPTLSPFHSTTAIKPL